MLSVGLTGGIATGKSTVLKMLADMGASVLSADSIVHELLDSDADVRRRVVAGFGPECVREDGGLDRAWLGRVVFSDARKRRELEEIIHPAVISRIAAWLEAESRRGTAVCVVEVPLLFETGLQGMFDTTVVVSSEHDVQAHRLNNRGLSPGESAARMGAQMPLADKEELAGYVLRNDGSLDELRTRVREFWENLSAGGEYPRI